MTFSEAVMQDKVWVRGENLETMDRHHRANLIPFLRRSADTLHFACYEQLMCSELMGVENPSDGVFAAQIHAERPFDQEPEDWLEQTPLMKKLIELESGRPLRDRRVTAARNKAHELLTGYKKQRVGFVSKDRDERGH